MEFKLKDGLGTGGLARVTDSRLYTSTIQESSTDYSSITGDSYNINTGIINLTSANKSATMYVKYTGDKSMVISGIFYLIGNSTGGSGDMLITILRNPTTGTIISGATDVEINAVNRNFDSPKTLSCLAYKGSEGTTFTNGTKVIESIFNQAPTRAFINAGYLVLRKNNSIGIDITPATGNTSLDIECAIALHEEH